MGRLEPGCLTLFAGCIFLQACMTVGGERAGLREGLETAAQVISDELSANELRKVAVVDFEVIGDVGPAIGQFVTEELAGHLFRLKPLHLDVFERQQLRKVLEEQELGASGVLDSRSATELGKILGVEAIVTGSIADLGEELAINARLISVELGRVLAVSEVRVVKDEGVRSLLRQVIAQVGNRPTSRSQELDGPEPQVDFENEFVRIVVRDLWPGVRLVQGRGKGANDRVQQTLTVVLDIENLINTELYLAAAIKSHDCAVTLVTDGGVSARLAQSDAMGLRCVYSTWGAKDYSELSAEGHTGATLVFAGDWESLGTTAWVTAELVRLHGGESQRLSVALSEIPIPQ